MERANYGSNFQKLGAATATTRAKSLGVADKKYYYNLTEQQFLQDPSSESEIENEAIEPIVELKPPTKKL